MEEENIAFNEKYRKRTKLMALMIMEFCHQLPGDSQGVIIEKQLVRSVTSVAANFRAATRARSKKEFYSKLCIVVEEADESLFWLELLEESHLNINKEELVKAKAEVIEILSIMAKTRKKVKSV